MNKIIKKYKENFEFWNAIKCMFNKHLRKGCCDKPVPKSMDDISDERVENCIGCKKRKRLEQELKELDK